MFFLGDVKGLIQEKSASAMKDVKWYTYNASVGYLVSGKLILFFEKISIGYKYHNIRNPKNYFLQTILF